ncbi:MAG: hypothetical protein E7671_00565 [Ruminococcaceae bacterium]|nr:hypothetical protein [Oscillospiraceae bacterium]
MSFKDMVEADNKAIFLNDSEFAEKHTVRYDGKEYADISVLFIKVKELDKKVRNMEGTFGITAVLYVAKSDLGGRTPEKGQRISLDTGKALGKPLFSVFKIATSKCEVGMVTLELEAYDE